MKIRIDRVSDAPVGPNGEKYIVIEINTLAELDAIMTKYDNDIILTNRKMHMEDPTLDWDCVIFDDWV